MQPLVSLIIPTYNSAQYIKEAIESVFSQTYKNIEVIVVDDGSTDNTKEVLGPYVGRMQYIHKENGGPASARNLGIRESKGEYIAFLDADDVWLPEKIEYQIKTMEENSNVGLVGCNVRWIDNVGRDVIIDNLEKGTYENYTNKKVFLKKLMFKNVVSSGSNACVKRECFDRVGIFDEDLNLKGVEDWDMWLRIASKYDIKFVEKFLLKKRLIKGSVCSWENSQGMLENEIYMIKKQFRTNSIFPKSLLLKARILDYRCLVAGWSYYHSNKKGKCIKCILRALRMYPLAITQKMFLGLVFRTILDFYDIIKKVRQLLVDIEWNIVLSHS